MIRNKRTVAAAMFILTTTVAAAGQRDDLLQPGLYDVEVRLVLPHLSEHTRVRTQRVCIVAAEVEPTRGLGSLSTNNPLAACRRSAVRPNNETLTFDIRCPGGNAARGAAR